MISKFILPYIEYVIYVIWYCEYHMSIIYDTVSSIYFWWYFICLQYALRNSKQQNPNTLLENEDPLTHLFPMHPFSVL